MVAMTLNDVMLTMTICIFFAGIVSLGAGIFVLISRVLNEDFRAITSETTKLARKGIADDVAGLVGNTSSLLEALNRLILTTSGIGFVLTLIGGLLIGFAFYLIQRIY